MLQLLQETLAGAEERETEEQAKHSISHNFLELGRFLFLKYAAGFS